MSTPEADAAARAVTPPRAALDLGLALTLVIAAALVAVPLGSLFPSPFELPSTIALQGAAVLLGLRVLLALRGQGWRDIGLGRPRPLDLARGLLALAACFAANAALTVTLYVLAPEVLEVHFDRMRALGHGLSAGLPLAAVAGLMFFVGLYEELLARGFLLDRCRTLLGRWWAAVLVSSLLFGLAHAYQGWIGALQTAVVGAVFAAFTIRWRTLWPVILAHAGLNLSSLLMLEEVGRST